eukprot:m.17251 g.17251  ORF g.17251 m.17251 type:complete len:159 (+) comp10662_c0_seq2:103-579(+)
MLSALLLPNKRLSFRPAFNLLHGRHLSCRMTLSSPKLDLFTEFLSEAEEEALLTEVAKPLRRLRYSPAHFDEAISGYRELRRSEWSTTALTIFQRVRQHPLLVDIPLDPSVHVLDLSPEGSIFPHVDSVKFVSAPTEAELVSVGDTTFDAGWTGCCWT